MIVKHQIVFCDDSGYRRTYCYNWVTDCYNAIHDCSESLSLSEAIKCIDRVSKFILDPKLIDFDCSFSFSLSESLECKDEYTTCYTEVEGIL